MGVAGTILKQGGQMDGDVQVGERWGDYEALSFKKHLRRTEFPIVTHFSLLGMLFISQFFLVHHRR